MTIAQHNLFRGIDAIAGGMLWLERTRTLIATDVHLAYEEVIGGALPLWSTRPSVATLCASARALQAAEIVLLGDVIHGARVSAGARARIDHALRELRSRARLEIIAGNHEGRTRGAALLGETHDFLERDGWLLLHGDRARLQCRAIVGHLHPSLHLGGPQSVPVFLASRQLIVVPALTPYSSGLDVRSDDCAAALALWNVAPKDVQVVAALPTQLFALGKLSMLRSDAGISARSRGRGYRRMFLQPDR